VYKTVAAASPLVMTVAPSTAAIRPYVVCAVLRGVTLNAARYASFIDLQDKLHNNICRRRTLVAIGTHDLDTLTPPFRYEARPPAEIEFTPLSQARSFRADALMQFYSTDPSVKHIKPYVDIIASSPVFPVIYDAKRTVLSLPPIINGEHSKISLATRNVLVECTATDLTKANIVLNTVVAMFSEYCAAPFEVEGVRVEYEQPVRAGTGGGDATVSAYVSPDLRTRTAEANAAELRSIIGAPISPEQAASLCSRMMLQGEVVPGATPADAVIRVTVPPTRSDILHAADVVEDVAIAYGYNNVARTLPATATTGEQLPINKLSDSLRAEIARAGYDETLTMALVSRDDNYDRMMTKDEGKAVVLANPQR
jgi:phenylalanyl-tRNA synthetase beta chain